MVFKHTWTGNWENAFRGLRHPMESYDRSDSEFWVCSESYLEENDTVLNFPNGHCVEVGNIGPNDLDLAQRMIKAGSPNDKFLRQIFVSVDITGPLYWWKELDTYKVATVANSTSTMHKLASTPITIDCFETDDLSDENLHIGNYNCLKFMYNQIIDDCESLRLKYLETKDVRYWKELIRWLPEGWLQTRTWSANYATLRNIIHWRSTHRLSEWKQFINFCKTLPYSKELLFYENRPE